MNIAQKYVDGLKKAYYENGGKNSGVSCLLESFTRQKPEFGGGK